MNPIGVVFDLLVQLFGKLMNIIYLGLDKVGLGNIALAIIIFTLITRILLYPSTVKQQKSSKLMSIIQPEIKAIQAKYEGRQDREAMMAQQAEMKAVYEKYGTSMAGNCVQLLIQMPIIFALYQVIMNIPKYVPTIGDKFRSIIELLKINGTELITNLITFSKANGNVGARALNGLNPDKIETINALSETDITNKAMEFLYQLNPEQMTKFAEQFPEAKTAIMQHYGEIEKVNTIFNGAINLSSAPNVNGFTLSPYILIPILAALSQYATSVIMQKQMKNKNADAEPDQMQQSMKSMNVMMPIVSAVFCWGFASGIGIYWVASSVFMMITYLIINKQLDKLDIQEMIKTNVEKANKKRAKKGLPPINEEKAADTLKRMEELAEKKNVEREKKLENQAKQTEEADKYYFGNESNPESLFAKANMVQKYNEKNK